MLRVHHALARSEAKPSSGPGQIASRSTRRSTKAAPAIEHHAAIRLASGKAAPNASRSHAALQVESVHDAREPIGIDALTAGYRVDVDEILAGVPHPPPLDVRPAGEAIERRRAGRGRRASRHVRSLAPDAERVPQVDETTGRPPTSPRWSGIQNRSGSCPQRCDSALHQCSQTEAGGVAFAIVGMSRDDPVGVRSAP